MATRRKSAHKIAIFRLLRGEGNSLVGFQTRGIPEFRAHGVDERRLLRIDVQPRPEPSSRRSLAYIGYGHGDGDWLPGPRLLREERETLYH